MEGKINQGKRRLITHLLYLFKIQIFNDLPGEKNRKNIFQATINQFPIPLLLLDLYCYCAVLSVILLVLQMICILNSFEYCM